MFILKLKLIVQNHRCIYVESYALAVICERSYKKQSPKVSECLQRVIVLFRNSSLHNKMLIYFIVKVCKGIPEKKKISCRNTNDNNHLRRRRTTTTAITTIRRTRPPTPPAMTATEIPALSPPFCWSASTSGGLAAIEEGTVVVQLFNFFLQWWQHNLININLKPLSPNLLQLFSSEASVQCSVPSHLQDLKIHWPWSHRNSLPLQAVVAGTTTMCTFNSSTLYTLTKLLTYVENFYFFNYYPGLYVS